MNRRFGSSQKFNPSNQGAETLAPQLTSTKVFRVGHGYLREAIEAAGNRIEKAKECKAQHGAARVLMAGGALGPDATEREREIVENQERDKRRAAIREGVERLKRRKVNTP